MKRLLLLALAGFCLTVPAFAAVDLNSATLAQLESVKGIGPAKAKAIVEYRRKHGLFKSVDELDKVSGFGKKTVDKVRAELTVVPAKPAAQVATKTPTGAQGKK